MTNKEALDIILESLIPEMNHRYDRHQRFDIRIKISERYLRIFSDYQQTSFDVIDTYTGKLVAIQPAEDSLTEVDSKWLNEKFITYAC
jgi:hypothetical protein